jgi:hypothetical protein
MHGVNLDLLRTVAHHPDGRPKDPHAHHRADLLAQRRTARRQLWQDRLARLRTILAHRPAPAAQPCPEHRP